MLDSGYKSLTYDLAHSCKDATKAVLKVVQAEMSLYDCITNRVGTYQKENAFDNRDRPPLRGLSETGGLLT